MDSLLEYLKPFSDFFTDKEVVIPAIQMVYYVGIINICMLLRRYRLCFLISLIFSFYWMFVLNQAKFISLDGTFGDSGVFALGGVLLVLMVSLFSFLTQTETD